MIWHIEPTQQPAPQISKTRQRIINFVQIFVFICIIALATSSAAAQQGAARSGHADWSGWSLDWSIPDSYEGLTLTDVSYEGHQVLEKSSLPVMRVFYDEAFCGPYADRLGGTLLPVSWFNNAEVVNRTFTQNGKQWLELGIQDIIGDYVIYQVWYLSEDGILDAHIFSKGLQCNLDHVHYPYWRMDFDVDGTDNDVIRAFQDGAWQQMTTEFDASAADAIGHQWEVRDTQTGMTVQIEPGQTDWALPGDNINVADQYNDNFLFGRVYQSAEDVGWIYGANAELPGNDGESLVGNDLVITYKGRMFHSAEEGPFLWHSAGPRFVVNLPQNNPPIANFSSQSTGELSLSFDGTASSDSDGNIVSHAWQFGDGATASGSNPSHSYTEAGSYDVTLTVTDDGGAQNATVQTIIVGDALPLSIDVEMFVSDSTVPPSGAAREYTVRVTNSSPPETWQHPIQVTGYVDSVLGELAPNPSTYMQTCFWWLPKLWPGQSWECRFNAAVAGGASGELLLSTVTVEGTTDAGASLSNSATIDVSVFGGNGTQTFDVWRNDANGASYYKAIDSDGDDATDTTGILIGDFNQNGLCDMYEIWWSADCIALSASDLSLLMATSTAHPDQRVNLLRELTATWLNIVAGNDYLCSGIDTAINLSAMWLHERAPGGEPFAGGSAVAAGSADWNNFSWSLGWLGWYNGGGGSCTIGRETASDYFDPTPLHDYFSPAAAAELEAILFNDGALRTQYNQFTLNSTITIMTEQSLTAANIAEAQALYDGLYAAASAELQTELHTLWQRGGGSNAENRNAETVWQQLWQPLAPTAVQLTTLESGATAQFEPFILILTVITAQFAFHVYRRNRPKI